ncbi:DUF4397 domain-containing protein [Chitinophaga sp. RAB17]|uniref:DUF4397 domain-containing protein n=1 Tax=Chitinophaga sp. RAB17 TaxID=3233049 RepID=UPI003F8DCAFF
MRKVVNASKTVAAFVLAGVFITACKKKTDPTPDAEISYLQVIHASPKTAEMLVNINQKKALHRVQYLSATKPYTSMLSGANLPVQLTLGSNIAAENKITFEKAANYSLFIYDTLKNNKVKFIVLKDVFTNPGVTKMNIRFLHLSPNTSPVDIDLFKGNDSIRLEKANAFIGDNPNTTALSTFKAITAGDYRVKVKIQVAGKPVTLIDIPKVQLTAQKTVTLFLRGLTNGTAGNETGLQVWQHK